MTIAINKILTNGIVFDLKNWDKEIMSNDNLLKNVEDLLKVLEQQKINYLLVGSLALLTYIDGRNTQDIDLILSRQDLENFSNILIIDENNYIIKANFNQIVINILLTENKLFNQILKECVTERKFGARLIRCVTIEGLIILKLYALPSLYRQGKFDKVSIYENDILLLMLNYSLELKSILTTLKKYIIKSDLQEIEDILVDIQSRIKRFSKQQKKLDN